jgi:hypothetical protein
MAKNNEGKCCDAILRILEEKHQATRMDVQRDTAARRGVEVTCAIGGQRYALEHTLIEPFPENQKDNIEFQRVFDESFEAQIDDLLKPDLLYHVYVHVYAFADMKATQLPAARKALIGWVRAAVPKLPPPSGPLQTWIHGEPPQTPVRVRLSCHRSKTLGGRLLTGRFAPAELETLRRERLLKALRDKSPKLHAAKLPGTRTVLVLENGDIALTNASIVGQVIDDLAQETAYVPDDIFMIDISTGNRLYVTQVRCDGRVSLIVGREAGHWEFQATDLVEI